MSFKYNIGDGVWNYGVRRYVLNRYVDKLGRNIYQLSLVKGVGSNVKTVHEGQIEGRFEAVAPPTPVKEPETIPGDVHGDYPVTPSSIMGVPSDFKQTYIIMGIAAIVTFFILSR